MQSPSKIPIASQVPPKRFAAWLALVYGTGFGLVGTHLPFFPVWLKAVGVDAAWIGIITAVPSVTRFTTLPFATGFAERHQALRGGIIAMGFATTIGLAAVGSQHQTVLIFLAYAVTCIVWTPMVPLTEYTPPVLYSKESRSKLLFLVEARLPNSPLRPGQPLDVRLK